MLNASSLAQALLDSFSNVTDRDGKKPTVPPELLAYAQGIVATLQAGAAAFPTGTVKASGVPASPVIGEASSDGELTLNSSIMVNATAAAFQGGTSSLTNENQTTIGAVQDGTVLEAAGSAIQGVCTASPLSPGPLSNGAITSSSMTTLSGADIKSQVASALGYEGPDMQKFYAALADYIKANGTAAFATGNVQGAFPPGGGEMAGGSASDGVIS